MTSKIKEIKWLEQLDKFELGNEIHGAYFQEALTRHAVETGQTLFDFNEDHDYKLWKDGKSLDLFEKEVLEKSLRAIKIFSRFRRDSRAHREYWAWKDGFLSVVSGRGFGPPEVVGDTFNTEDVVTIGEWLDEATKERPAVPRAAGNDIWALLQTFTGINIQRISWIDAPIVRENYSEKVLEGYETVVKELQNTHPNGKITILDGPPGTGKTWLIRNIVHQCDNTRFVVVPPEMIKEIGKPELLPMLLSHRSGDQPMVLILEDADEMLSERMTDSMTSITAALNIGDGLLGDALNLRLLCSTNQPLSNIDPAMRRPGRLSCRIEVRGLELEKAQSLFESKGGQGKIGDYFANDDDILLDKSGGSFTLAEVYEAARRSNLEQEKED